MNPTDSTPFGPSLTPRAAFERTDPVPDRDAVSGTTPRRRSPRAVVSFALKALFSLAMLLVIVRKIVQQNGAESFAEYLARLSWGWIAAAVAMQLLAIACSTVRWQRLLVGQGIRPTWGFLSGSIMIARFFGAFTPGGFTGFGGWRIYDVAKHTGKTARAAATIGVEMILGQLSFGVVVLSGSLFGLRFIGLEGVLLVNAFFLVLVTTGLLFLSRPTLFQTIAAFLPASIRERIGTLVDAACAYHGKSRLLVEAALLGVGTHAFNNLIYVCAARALGVELGVGEVFFGSSLQIFATLLPTSINGVGLREITAVALYTNLGVPAALAVLIPIVGFSCEMFVSAFGGVIFVARRRGYSPHIVVDDDERERRREAAIEFVPESERPRVARGAVVGFGAGLVAGGIVGLGEAIAVIHGGTGSASVGVLAYGAIAYGLFVSLLGAVAGAGLAGTGRRMGRRALPESDAWAHLVAALVAGFGFVLATFRIRRDVFSEQLAWKSPKGLLVLFASMLAAVALYALLAVVLRALARRKPSSLRAPFGSLAAFGALAGGALLAPLVAGPASAAPIAPAAPARAGAPHVFVFVVDTLRADHLPTYGYERGSTPALDRFAEDAIRFDQAFANASWTRPSFASILTGRYASSHGVMHKADALPDGVETIAEVLHGAGYRTSGLVTNYNVAPYFNFHQGFDDYRYLEPEFVLFADDAAAKLSLVQILRRPIERYQAMTGRVPRGAAYRDAEVVNREVRALLDARDERGDDAPLFLFTAYMDPHDPYYDHPYTGRAYARAAHPRPEVGDADRLRALYDGEITYWDREFGALLDSLRERRLYDDALIVVTSDHGEEFADHGGFWHGTTLYDEQVRVPLFVKLPGNRQAGTVVRHWVQSVDIAPTLLREAHVDVPAAMQGGDLFEGTERVFAEESHEGNVLEAVRERRGTDERKLITANPGNPRGLPSIELFRVDVDPGEREDLARDDVDGVRTTMNALVEAREAARRGAAERRTVDVDEASAERLKALGYAGE